MKAFIEMISRWGEMPPAFYERLRELVVTVELKTGEILNKDGAEFTGMYFLESGHLWCFKDVVRVVVWFMEPGKGDGFVRPPAAFDPANPYNEFVQALDPCTLSFVSSETLAVLNKEFPEFMDIAMAMMERLWAEGN